ncbi:unnamed protein product [Gadus morhua 'NCC']
MLSNPRHSQLEEWEISDRVELAQELLTRVETECAMVGLRLNAKNTEIAVSVQGSLVKVTPKASKCDNQQA